MHRRPCLALAPSLLLSCAALAAQDLPIIDAHSQFDQDVPIERVVESAARAGIAQVVLSARGSTTSADVLELAGRYPGCILPAVRTKGAAFRDNDPHYPAFLDGQLKAPAFKAINEIIVAHARKGRHAPEVNLTLDAPQVALAIQHAVARGWPVVLHYELRWFTRSHGRRAREERLAELRALLRRHPDHPFALIHMAQIDAADAAALLDSHASLVFLTSHANPITATASRQPWTDLFIENELAPEWRALVLRHPDRFVLAFDNVWTGDWTGKYADQARLWRGALAKLPAEVAHAVAHGNAERLWKLPPARAGQGCAAIPPPAQTRH